VTLYTGLRARVATSGNRLAVISDRGTRTYAELAENVGRLMHGLRFEMKLGPDARIAIWGWNSLEWAEAFLAAMSLGMNCFPINPEWTATEAAAALTSLDIELLICDADLSARAETVREQTPGLGHILLLHQGAGLSLEVLRERAPSDWEAQLESAHQAGVYTLFTSGTTGGRYKAVMRKKTSKPIMGANFTMEGLFELDESDRMMVATPLFHGNALSALVVALGFGGSIMFPRRFSASRFWSMVDCYRPTFLFTLMPIINILMSLPVSGAERRNSFEKILALGIAPYAEAVEQRYGVKAIDWYGSSEIGGAVYTPLHEQRPAGSTGKTLPGVVMHILRSDRSVCAPGEVGEVAFPLDTLEFSEYGGNEAATSEAIRDGYFMSGDMAYVDENGWFFFVDRIKDIVRRGGENISSIEVETVLFEHPAISEIAIVPRPDPVLGERVTAFIVPFEGASAPTIDELQAFVGDRLSSFKLPDLIIEVDALPRTENGKIKKAVLKEQLARSAGTQTAPA